MSPRALAVLATVLAFMLVAVGAHAATTPEQQCQKARFTGLSRYAACEAKVIAKHFGDDVVGPDRVNCTVTHVSNAWVKIQTRTSGTGSSCDEGQYATIGATVVDRMTGLQWEMKSDDGGIHDKDNAYSWTDAGDADLTNADGTVWAFVTTLNTPPCFGGHCDWRLPSRAELNTIALIIWTEEPAEPPLGVWSSTTFANDAERAFVLRAHTSPAPLDATTKDLLYGVRAVRGGW